MFAITSSKALPPLGKVITTFNFTPILLREHSELWDTAREGGINEMLLQIIARWLSIKNLSAIQGEFVILVTRGEWEV